MVVATQAPAETLRPLTIEDLEDFPDDGQRHEIITGELIVTAAPTPAHQIIVGRLFRAIADHAERNDLGTTISSPVDVRLSPHDVVEPDVVFIARGREALLDGKFIDGVPDLVIEVLSPSTQRKDLVPKRALYAWARINEYWIADPANKTLTILRLDRNVNTYVPVLLQGNMIESNVVAGLRIDPQQLFANLPSEEARGATSEQVSS